MDPVSPPGPAKGSRPARDTRPGPRSCANARLENVSPLSSTITTAPVSTNQAPVASRKPNESIGILELPPAASHWPPAIHAPGPSRERPCQ